MTMEKCATVYLTSVEQAATEISPLSFIALSVSYSCLVFAFPKRERGALGEKCERKSSRERKREAEAWAHFRRMDI